MWQIKLKPEEFALFRHLIYEKIGIFLSEQKDSLVQGRLQQRIMELQLPSYRAYYNYVVQDYTGEEFARLVNAISTNVTSFFREEAQWVWLEEYLPRLDKLKSDKKLRIWSAGCSSGEEPYSIIIFLKRYLEDFERWDVKILATDISERALSIALHGYYSAAQVETLSKEIISESFNKECDETGETRYQIVEPLRKHVMFRTFNLVTDPFFFKNRFDMIFCRNVMIYFDAPTRAQVIERFTRVLKVDAPLLLGSSESLSAFHDRYKLIGSSIYLKTH